MRTGPDGGAAARPSGLRLLALVVAMAAADPPSGTTVSNSANRSGPAGADSPRRPRPSRREQPDQVDLRDDVVSGSGAESQRVEALVTLAQDGDVDAFGELYEHYVDSVYRYVYARVGDVSLAEDITADTFLRALRRLDSFSWQGRDIAAWFITIARNLVTDHRRSSRFRLELSTDELLLVDRGREHVASGQSRSTPEDEVLARSRDAALLDAVRRLRPDQQECVVLRFFQDFTIAQTAKALGRSEGAVKQLQLRAVRALAEIMEEAP